MVHSQRATCGAYSALATGCWRVAFCLLTLGRGLRRDSLCHRNLQRNGGFGCDRRAIRGGDNRSTPSSRQSIFKDRYKSDGQENGAGNQGQGTPS